MSKSKVEIINSVEYIEGMPLEYWKSRACYVTDCPHQIFEVGSKFCEEHMAQKPPLLPERAQELLKRGKFFAP
jgi:hypothetical protein